MAASEQLERSFRSVQSTVRSSHNNVNASIGSVRAYSQSVISADSALKATEAGYEVGPHHRRRAGLHPAVWAKQKLSEARYSYILASSPWKRAAGILEQKDLERVNQGSAPASPVKKPVLDSRTPLKRRPGVAISLLSAGSAFWSGPAGGAADVSHKRACSPIQHRPVAV